MCYLCLPIAAKDFRLALVHVQEGGGEGGGRAKGG